MPCTVHTTTAGAQSTIRDLEEAARQLLVLHGAREVGELR